LLSFNSISKTQGEDNDHVIFQKRLPFLQKGPGNLHEEAATDFQVFYKQNADNKKHAKKIGGKVLFPLLIDEKHGVIMYESDDIVQYLRDNYGHLKQMKNTI